MREPKYKLNKSDAARFHELVVRECLAGSVKGRKYPPLTAAEKKELARLDRKRSRRINSHPAMKAALRAQRNHSRKIERLFRKLESVFAAPVK